MLRILGSPLGAGNLHRRDLLRAGGLGLLANSLQPFTAAAATNAKNDDHGSTFGRAKACIILYLYGAPSQLETYDPKPDAPLEIRGEFNSIETALPGLRVCEHLPKLAKVVDRAAVIRSMVHPYNIHSAAYTLTGVPHVDVPMELNPHDSRHWPYIGSVLDFLAEQKGNSRTVGVPSSMGLPFKFSSRCAEFQRGGPYGGFLGAKYDPVWTEFEGASTRRVDRWRGNRDQNVDDPFLGISPRDRFVVSGEAKLPPEITLDRLDRRRTLLEQLDAQRRDLHTAGSVQVHSRFQDMALELMTSNEIRAALDVQSEDVKLREQYGMTLFGQATLAARRLVEAGTKIVTVFWDEYATANSAWDTHFDHYPLRDELLPGLDGALSALLLDLENRGLLDTTLVACVTEHGRTPKITNVRGAGREHWSRSYCGLLAGGGVRGGQVIGRSDEHASDVAERPVSPKDVLATMYHLLGVSPETMLRDRFGRPLPLVADGKLMREIV